MKKVFIVLSTALLLLAILTFSSCTGGIPETANSGNGQEIWLGAECEAIYGRLCTEARKAAMQHSNLIFFIGSGRGSESGPGTMQVRRDQAGFASPAPAGNRNPRETSALPPKKDKTSSSNKKVTSSLFSREKA